MSRKPWLAVIGVVGLLLSGAPADAARAPKPKPVPAPAVDPGRLTVHWLGIAGLAITDGEATLLFDPAFTKPSIRHWVLGSRYLPDLEQVRRGLARAGVSAADAMFVSHTHFDHTVDAAAISQLTGAVVHGGKSLERVLRANDFPVRFESAVDRKTVPVGRFRVTMIRRTHPPVLQRFGLRFLEGPVPEDFDFRFYDYRDGEVWAFHVAHPAGDLLIDQSSHFFPPNAVYHGKIDTYFVGVANRRSLEDLVLGNIQQIAPKRVVPLHFDWFFLQWEWMERFRWLGGTLDDLRSRLQRGPEPRPELVVPTLTQAITIP